MPFPKGQERTPLVERFEQKVERHDEGCPCCSGCWHWTGYRDKAGYARLRQGGRQMPVLYVHRYAYERHVGLIPAGRVIDHLCRNRGCVNPAHLEVVTQAENARRAIHPNQPHRGTGKCRRGHEHTTEACYVKGRFIYCRACRREDRRAQRKGLPADDR